MTAISYEGYMWASNWISENHMEMTVELANTIPLFFMCLIFTCGTCFAVDLAIESIQQLIIPSPSRVLREMIYRKQDIT
jgi:hypothetical protein